MIVLSRSLLLAPEPHVNLAAPVILWRNIVTADMIEASSEAEVYPATNMASDRTIEYWRATDTDEQIITLDTGGARISEIGIARHNLGSSNAMVSVEILTSLPWLLRTEFWGPGFWRTDDDPEEENAWIEVIEPRVLPDNGPVLFRFAPIFAGEVRIRIVPQDTPPSIAVLYAGEALVMPHGISAPHVPLDQGRDTQVVTGTSESGEYLGRIITGQSSRTGARFQNLKIDWYYEHMEAFIQRGTSGPFFFAWLPMSRPNDVGYAWLVSDPQPPMGSLYFDVTLEIGGIAQ